MTIDIFSKDTETMKYCVLWKYKKVFYYLGLLYKLLNEYVNLLINKWVYVTQGNYLGLQCLRVCHCLLSAPRATSYCLKSNTGFKPTFQMFISKTRC